LVAAALYREAGKPLEVVDIEVALPGPGQVAVDLAASGVCHSDLSVVNGTLPYPPPIVLGHEGAGTVTSVGEGVTRAKVGDHVVLSWIAQCGTCWHCTHGEAHLCQAGGAAATAFSLDGQPVAQFTGLGTFAAATVVPETSVVVIDDDVPLHLAALIGCGVLTGAGAALTTGNVQPGGSVAVVGCGGVGVNAIQGARLAGATTIIAIDTNPAKLEIATRFGATEVVDASAVDPSKAVRAATEGRGVDVAIEAIGRVETAELALRITRRGGNAVLVGMPGGEAQLSVGLLGFVSAARQVTGCLYGSADVQRDVPRLLRAWRDSDLLLQELVSREIGLDEVNEAFAAIEAGTVTRSLIRY
jgi:S-(hydroxymethyl)glutathione dehydrogenase / alcohol dehydrogenase